jgi:plastocyanin
VLALTAALAACSSDDPAYGTAPTGVTPPTGTAPVSAAAVQVRDNAFNPAAITVSPGARITFTWSGNNPHNVIWAAGNLANASAQTSGAHEVTMPTARGEYVYYCSLHGSASGGMRGAVRVE